MKSSPCAVVTILTVALLTSPAAFGDLLEFKDGSALLDCYVRDEGVRFIVWDSLEKVGTPDYRVIPRSRIAPTLSSRYLKLIGGEEKRFRRKNPITLRDETWDAQPPLPDLSVTFIEMNPKLAGLHGRIEYDVTMAPCIGSRPPRRKGEERRLTPAIEKRLKELEEQGKDKYLHPEYIVQDLKLKYEPGEEITFTAHVKNLGFVKSKPFEYRWLIDDREAARGTYRKSLAEMEEATFEHTYIWQDGRHTVTFAIITDQDEVAAINNTATDAMWAFAFFYIVDRKRVEAWHQNRTGYGTFSWEDYYRWHLDIMNLLFAESVYPSAPNGIEARVRLDKIYYLDAVDPETAANVRFHDDGTGYDQGGWIWYVRKRRNKPKPTTVTPAHEYRNRTEWSLPHELGHQLGLVDYYQLDHRGHEWHTWPDTGEPIAHFQNHPRTMMHWHGAHVFSELSAMYLNMTMTKPRGHFGDHYFAMPAENYLHILDVNGRGVPNATVEVFQRGTEVDPSAEPQVDHGVTWYPVVEDGVFRKPVSKDPVIVGTTDKDGFLRLPNREAKEVRTLNGYHRKPNPFGNLTIVGQRCLMLVKVTKNRRPTWFWLEAIDFNLAWYTGHKDKYTMTLRTPYGSADSPKPPVNVRWEYTDKTKKVARVTWRAPAVRERNYLETPIAYRVYRRRGPMGLNDRPWFPVATVNVDTREFIVDLEKLYVNDIDWFSKTDRFAVSSLAALSIESELVQANNMDPKEE